MKILGLGNALVDVLIQLDNDRIIKELGFPKGSMQLISVNEIPVIVKLTENLPTVMVSGGSAANTIHGLSRLGSTCGYIGKVGIDKFGQFYKQDFNKAGVNTFLYKSKTDTGRAYTLITPDSERTFATYLGAAIEMVASEISGEIILNYDIIHIEGYLVQNKELLEKAMKLAKKKHILVSLDLASFNVVEAHHNFLSRIIPEYVDILFANKDEAKAYIKKDPENALADLAEQVKIAVVKIGSEGSWIQSGNEKVKIDVIPMKALDTTGAGDQYAAGFLYGYTNKFGLKQCGKLGSILASKVIDNYGARIVDTLWNDILIERDKLKALV